MQEAINFFGTWTHQPSDIFVFCAISQAGVAEKFGLLVALEFYITHDDSERIHSSVTDRGIECTITRRLVT